jgi:hypothetical protein
VQAKGEMKKIIYSKLTVDDSEIAVVVARGF